jgi:hypothetical protein
MKTIGQWISKQKMSFERTSFHIFENVHLLSDLSLLTQNNNELTFSMAKFSPEEGKYVSVQLSLELILVYFSGERSFFGCVYFWIVF